MAALVKGTRVERYEVESVLGRGGMASVYRVRHVQLGTLHALKVLEVGGGRAEARLLTEGRIQAAMRHPNIVAVTDVLDVQGRPALLLEYLPPPNLHDVIRAGVPSVAEAERLFAGIVAGVAHAHHHGLVHRDLKPSNVLLAPGPSGAVPRIADFGIAKVLEDAPGNGTRSGSAMGTPTYMAPEQLRDARRVDQRADIFALGIMLHELLTGRVPYEEDDLITLYQRMRQEQYGDLSEVPSRFRAAIQGCLFYDRERRIPDCATLVAILAGERAPSDAVRQPPLDAIGPPTLAAAATALHGAGPTLAAPIPRVDGASADPERGLPPPTLSLLPDLETRLRVSSPVGSVGRSAPQTERVSTRLPEPAGPTVQVEDASSGPGDSTPVRRAPWAIGIVSGVLLVMAVTVGVLRPWSGSESAAEPEGETPSAALSGEASPPASDPAPVAPGPIEAPTTAAAGVGSLGGAPAETPRAGMESLPKDKPAASGKLGVTSTSSPPSSGAASPGKATPDKDLTPRPQPAPEGTAPTATALASAPVLSPPPPTTTPPGSTVRLAGDASAVVLRNTAGTFRTGEVPAGTYTVVADFPSGAGVTAGTVTLKAGENVTITCHSASLRCGR